MDTNLENRILDLLLETPTRALPVHEVHRVLTTELGVRAGTLGQLRERLRDGTGELLLVEPENPLGEVADWPPVLRDEYEVALRDAGVDVGPWVTATAPGSQAEAGLAPALLRASLLELWRSCNGKKGLRTAVAKALADMRPHRTDDSIPACAPPLRSPGGKPVR